MRCICQSRVTVGEFAERKDEQGNPNGKEDDDWRSDPARAPLISHRPFTEGAPPRTVLERGELIPC